MASEAIPGADGPVDVILGAGAALTFAGVVIRAFAARWPRRPRAGRQADRERPRPGTAGRPTEPSDGDVEDREFERHEPIVGAPEPELFRLRSETLGPLGRSLDRGRRLAAAEERVALELAHLPDGFWLVERGVLVDGRRTPFLVVGATGVFAICASDGAWTLRDLHVMAELGDEVLGLLPGYDGTPRAAVCLAFDEMRPRAWFGGEAMRGHGGWVLGVDWLQRWIFGFGPEHGLRNGDVRRLDEASGPCWDRRSTARLPASPHFG